MSDKAIHIMFFNTEIDEESTKKLLSEIQENQGKKIYLYFSTDGGLITYAEIILNFFNSPDIIENLKLIAFWDLASCGFDIFMGFNGEKELIPHAYAIVHEADWSNSVKKLKRKEPEEVGLNEYYNNYNRKTLEKYRKWGLTNEELSIIEKGEDLFLPYERLCELVEGKENQKTKKNTHPDNNKLIDGALYRVSVQSLNKVGLAIYFLQYDRFFVLETIGEPIQAAVKDCEYQFAYSLHVNTTNWRKLLKKYFRISNGLLLLSCNTVFTAFYNAYQEYFQLKPQKPTPPPMREIKEGEIPKREKLPPIEEKDLIRMK